MKRHLPGFLACILALLSGCATGARDQDLVESLLDEAASRANASAQGGLNVRPFVLSITGGGVIEEWGSDPGFGNIAGSEDVVHDELGWYLERAQRHDHRAIVWVGYDLGPDGRAGEMILAARDVSGQVGEQRRPLVRRARVELPFGNR
jgi:hypothetical protein